MFRLKEPEAPVDKVRKLTYDVMSFDMTTTILDEMTCTPRLEKTMYSV